jgi:hypothetical protein
VKRVASESREDRNGVDTTLAPDEVEYKYEEEKERKRRKLRI